MSRLLFVLIATLSFSVLTHAQVPAQQSAGVDIILTTGWIPGFGSVIINSLSNHSVEVTRVVDSGKSTCPSIPGVACDPLPPHKPTPVTVTPVVISDQRDRDGALTLQLGEYVLYVTEGVTPQQRQGGKRYALGSKDAIMLLHTEVRITK